MSDTGDQPGLAGADDRGAPVSRRAALKVLGVLPVAGVVGAAEAQQQQPRTPHTTPNQPAGATPQPASNNATRKFFTAREWRTAGVLADDIIPRDERSGSATEAGVVAYIDYHMSVPETNDDARVAMRGGLRWMDTETRRRFGVAYDKATPAQRTQLLDDIAGASDRTRPEMRRGAAFFASFRNYVGAGFFSSAVGWKDLQYTGNVFNPRWDGCPEPALRKLDVSYDVMSTRVAPE